jgi:diguanylate cyclase (GGDEF)-like protein
LAIVEWNSDVISQKRQAITQQSRVKPRRLPSGDSASLVVIDGPRLGQCVRVHEVPVVIGRSPKADLQIEHSSVSRLHCSVWQEGSEVYVRDLGSKNGTYVNAVRIGMAELGEGTIIAIGDIVLKFVHGGSHEARYHEALYELATVDSLTQLHNRREFRNCLEDAVNRLHEQNAPLSVAIFDLDHFKQINDLLGHDVGDSALRRLAELLRHELRHGDTAGRLGGDEFAVLLRDCPAPEAAEWGENLRASVHALGLEGGPLPATITISVGVATWSPAMQTAGEMLRLADMALLRAKAGGRDRLCGASDM